MDKWVRGLVFALAGCAGQVEDPEPRIVRVEVPVVVRLVFRTPGGGDYCRKIQVVSY